MQDRHGVPYRSLVGMVRSCAARYAGCPAIGYKKEGAFTALTYERLYERVLMAARGLCKAGVRAGDRVAILSENRAGWVIADLAIQSLHGVSVPIYATNTAEQVAYVLDHAAVRIVFVSTRLQYRKLLQLRGELPGVELVVSFERFLGEQALPVYTLYQLSEISHPLSAAERAELEAGIDEIEPDELLSIIYTSGTTGVPKGVMLSHGNVLFDAYHGSRQLGGLRAGEVFLSFLPLSHVLERTAGYYAALMHGCHVVFAESVDKVVENIREVRPTVMVSVPRLFEKIHSRIYESVHQMGPLRRRLFHRAVAVGREFVARRHLRGERTGLLGLRYRLADRLVFRRIRRRFGGRLRFFLSGGAPLDRTVNEFLWILGIPTFEGYGLTETSPAIALNAPGAVRFGSVGRPLPHTEVRLAEDGELLVRGPQVMRGYYRDPEGSAAVLDDGWFATGDIARLDGEGFIYIVDRKKEIIVTAGGKNIAPQPLENELRLDKYISQACVFGDRKSYLVALLTPNLEWLLEFAQQERLAYMDLEDLVAGERVRALFAARVAQLNARLPSYETLKRFALLPRDFTVEGGELTPTLKLRRRVIYEKYQEKIEALYLCDGAAACGQKSQPNGGKA